MALKPTIYKLNISLSDLDRDYYDTLNLTVALHPSETLERMMVRILAFCLNASEQLRFTKGLSSPDEPDIWAHTLDGQISIWIDIGEPSIERVKKATRLAKRVKVYCFNPKSDIWWEQSQNKLGQLNAAIIQFPWAGIQSLAALVERTMKLSVTITDDSAYVATELGECEISWTILKA